MLLYLTWKVFFQKPRAKVEEFIGADEAEGETQTGPRKMPNPHNGRRHDNCARYDQAWIKSAYWNAYIDIQREEWTA